MVLDEYKEKRQTTSGIASEEQIIKPLEHINKLTPEALSLLLERVNSPPNLTPERIAEESILDEEQVASAQKWLQSPDPQQRLAGAEQLSAYPNPHAEKLLANALTNDPNPQVRSSAARSLEFFENPKDNTLIALLNRLKDKNEEVRMTALGTLETYIGNEPYGSVRSKQILKKLKKAARFRNISKDTRKSIQDFLTEQSL
jgi:HEAT repeat protein